MINALHLHLAINHSPLYTELFAFALLVIGMARRNGTLVNAALVITIIAALCAGAAYWSGDEASDLIDKGSPIAGVDKTMIEPHEDAAGFFLGAACLNGVLAIAALFIGWRRERPRWLEVVVAVAIFFSLTIVARTAYLGGRIHHPEVRALTSPSDTK
jgi:hypothetical protein